MRIMVYNQGANSGTIKLIGYPAGNDDLPICESNTINLSDITENFLGFVRFDFNRENIHKDYVLDIHAVISGYTRNGEVSYFSMIFDYPNPIYDNLGTSFINHPIAIEEFFYL